MKLLKAAGLIKETDSKEILELLIDNVILFQRAGGILTLDDWAELNDTERIAFIMAREKMIIDSTEYNSLEEAVTKASEKIENKTDE